MKICTKCGEAKAPQQFSKGPGEFGRRANCKVCASLAGRIHYTENRARIRARLKQYAITHKAENAARAALYREKNREKIAAYHAELYVKNKAAIDARNKQWAAENKERKSAYGSAWAKENAGRVRAKVSARRFAKLNATPKWADKTEIERIYAEARRLTKETGIPHEVDHIFPLKGETAVGLHVQYNLQILTMAENRRKSNSMPGASC